MTRGRIYLFDRAGICHVSSQYPCDMYMDLPYGHGTSIITAFLRRQIRNEKEFRVFLKETYRKWGHEHITQDDDDFIQRRGMDYSVELNGIGDDYSYCLNCSGKSACVCLNGDEIRLEKDEMLVLHFTERIFVIKRTRGKTTQKFVDEEIRLCIDALDYYSRMFVGQYDHIDFMLSWRMKNTDQLRKAEFTREHLYAAVRSRVFRGTAIEASGLNASLGIWNEMTDDKAKSSYDIQQIMRYHYAFCRKPEGDYSVDFRKPVMGGSLPEIICKCVKDGDCFVETVTMTAAHVHILDDALMLLGLCHRHEMRRMFEYFTEDSISLQIAAIIEKLYRGVRVDKDYINRIDILRKKIIFAGAANVDDVSSNRKASGN